MKRNLSQKKAPLNTTEKTHALEREGQRKRESVEKKKKKKEGNPSRSFDMSDWYIPPENAQPRGVDDDDDDDDEKMMNAEERAERGEGGTTATTTRTSTGGRRDIDDDERKRRKKVYQIWPGNDTFFWDGRIIVGPNYKAFLHTIALVTVPSIVFTAAVAPTLSREYSWAWQAVSVVWPIYVVGCLVRTGTMDPGILPRLPRPPPRDRNDPPRERVRDVPHEPTKKLVTVKWNDTTNFFQPPRAHHCSINNDCVEKFDHHCPWVGTTIGRRNYRHFLLFVFGTTLWCGFVVSSCVMCILTEIDERNDEVDPVTGERVNTQAVTGALKASGAAIFCGIVALFGFMFVFALSVFHIVLIWQNQTTYENFRERRVSEDNPYTRGNCCKNCFEIFCEPIPPSWFDFRRYVDEDDSADRFAEHMRKRGLLLQEQDPEIAKKETEKRLAEFTEDLEKAKEKIAYKQNLELSEQVVSKEGKNPEEDGIGTRMKNALVNVFGSSSIGTKTFKVDRNNADADGGKEGDNNDEDNQEEELKGFESPIVFDENYVPDILRQQQSSDEDGGSEASVSSSGSSDIDERKRRFQLEKGRDGARRKSDDDDHDDSDDDDNAEKEGNDDDDDDGYSSSLSESFKKPNDERDDDADNEEQSGASSSEYYASSSSGRSNNNNNNNNINSDSDSVSCSSFSGLDDNEDDEGPSSSSSSSRT